MGGFAAGKAAADKGDHATAARGVESCRKKGDVGSQVALGFLYQKVWGSKAGYGPSRLLVGQALRHRVARSDMRLVARVYLTGAPGVELDAQIHEVLPRRRQKQMMHCAIEPGPAVESFARDDDDLKAGCLLVYATRSLNNRVAGGHAQSGRDARKGIGVPADAERIQEMAPRQKTAHPGELCQRKK